MKSWSIEDSGRRNTSEQPREKLLMADGAEHRVRGARDQRLRQGRRIVDHGNDRHLGTRLTQPPYD